MVVRGVPHRIAKDAWWLDDADPPAGLRAGPVLILALVLVDVLVWGVRPGLGLALWMLAIGGAIALTVFYRLEVRRLAKASAILVLAILPLFEVVQFGSVMVALLGLVTFGVMIAGTQVDTAMLWRAVARVPGYGIVQTARDALALRVTTPSKGSLRGLLFDWGLPVAVGGVFLILMVAANPILDRWLISFADFDVDFLPQTGRVVFWGLAALAVWPLLRLAAMMPALTRDKPAKIRALRSGFLNERSVLRAMVTFNLIFLIQTTLDMGILWGGVALPEGMTYANYAHRGAYPLLATALMAGVFALMAQPYLGTGRAVRMLLYLWIAQTVILVISSILRLDLYVDVYGLTRLRFAAFVWMVVVALGLVLIIMQMVGRHSVGWFFQRAFGLGLLAIYLCNLVNIDGYIARHNLADDRDNDYYLCRLSEGAAPAIRAHQVAIGKEICDPHRVQVSRRDDWREWGYRNARLHRSLAEMETNL
ncbi:DUF4173 domain-containing protein [Yoonia sp. F2084L]|uniref:DUF4153 domain-containing protein n=1 Tax=Yoonia sp. F2084L TaxID=2926419 RepID=UPI001FF42357|nr:DUF4173 domain-containing protein [Yoonia sp. F2084L]MCK0096187.1 DUF4173 domain-containing protein [Yoonia sp. F2084L]